MSPNDVAQVRAFNRFHSRWVGVLDEHLLQSDYSLSEVRVLYEIATAPRGQAPSGREIADFLQVDPGYVSRIVSTFESNGVIRRSPTPSNGKRLALSLTNKGKKQFDKLNAASEKEVTSQLKTLTDSERTALVGAMCRIRRFLGDSPSEKTFILRDPIPGDLGIIISRQACLYAREYGWDLTYEASVAKIVGNFVQHFIPGKERCWLAEWEGEIIGSVFIVRDDDDTARLRLLYVDKTARGFGLGSRLVNECIRFAKDAGYKRMRLWTNDVLVSARKIYLAAGFRLIEEQAHHSFGKDLVGQTWELDL